MNTVAQSVYPVLAPVVVFLIIYAIQKWLSKPDEVAGDLKSLKEEMQVKIEELEDKLYKQEKESWDKMNGLRGDIIRIQTKLNGVGWGARKDSH